MATRKNLSKKTRFEVFKRDSFTCQYCGAKAPDVILEVDHINPIAEGGTNDILNLITSCRNCNRGKSKTKLSDNASVIKQQKQAEELQQRRELIEMMSEWHKQLLEESALQINEINELIDSYYEGYVLTERGEREFKALIKRFGYSEVYESLDIALQTYDDFDVALDKVGGICYNRKVGRTW